MHSSVQYLGRCTSQAPWDQQIEPSVAKKFQSRWSKSLCIADELSSTRSKFARDDTTYKNAHPYHLKHYFEHILTATSRGKKSVAKALATTYKRSMLWKTWIKKMLLKPWEVISNDTMIVNFSSYQMSFLTFDSICLENIVDKLSRN